MKIIKKLVKKVISCYNAITLGLTKKKYYQKCENCGTEKNA